MSEYREIGSFIDRTYKVVRQDLINRFKQIGVDITPEQWVILSKIGEQDMYQTDLAQLSFRDKPTISRIVDLLVKKELVERIKDTSDKRKFHVRITSKGRETIDKATPVVEESRKVGWKNLTEEEYHTLVFLLDKIFANYSEEGWLR